MEDVFVYHECQSTRWSHSTKNRNKQTQSKQRFTMFVRLVHMPFLYILSTCSFFHVPFLYVLSTCSFFHVPFLYVLSSWLFCYFVCFLRAFSIRFVYLFVCLFCKGLSSTFCLDVRFNCIKRAVFKPLIFPAYSTNIVIVIFHKWPPLSSDLAQPFAANGLPLLSFLTCIN